MKFVVGTTSLTTFLLLGLKISGSESAMCAGLYADAFPSGPALSCTDFAGDEKLHGILYGCKTLNQDVVPPPRIKSQSFTEICEANVAANKKFTCYQMAADTDFAPFTNSVDPNLACGATGDEFNTPKYMYLQTTAEYTHSGGAGSQKTSVPHLVDDFSADFAGNAYYLVTVEEGEGMTPNPALVASPSPAPDTTMEEGDHDNAEPADEGTTDGAADTSSTPAPATGGEGQLDVAADEEGDSSGGFNHHRVIILLATIGGVGFLVF